MTDPTSVITTAAYLLFYRRRSSGPLGGPRFQQIFEKYDMEHSDSDAMESGEEDVSLQRSAKTTVTPLMGPDDDELPAYNDSTIRRSIEDDGSFDGVESKAINMTQGWNFTGLDERLGDVSAEADCASDDAQCNSSDDERGPVISEQDMDTTSIVPFDDSSSWNNRDVMSVPTDGAEEVISDEVTEIHLDGDRTMRGD